MYIYQHKNWPDFIWNNEKIFEQLSRVRYMQGLLLGKMNNLGFDFKNEARLKILTQDIIHSSDIEGEILNKEQVRSSIARRLGFDAGTDIYIERNVEGVVEMMLDATQNYNTSLTKSRLLSWHASLFPGGYSGIHKIRTGSFRNDKNGPMQVLSGPIGKETIHYEAVSADALPHEIKNFLTWFNRTQEIDLILAAAISHLWFVTIHPFDDGNGRIARALTDMVLARDEQSPYRFYSLSTQIRKDRNEYYNILEKTQKGTLDITLWLSWFLDCFKNAVVNTEDILSLVFTKAEFWLKNVPVNFNERQVKVINRFLDGFEGNLTSSKWAKIAKTSQDSANRDIADLIEKKIITKKGSGRSTHYIVNL